MQQATENVAIIDLGSNSIRLVIMEIDVNGRFREKENLKIVAKLSTHVKDDQTISDEGVQIVLDTMKRFKTIIDAHSVSRVRGVATAAVRKAKNQTYLLNRVEEETNLQFDVLSGDKESYYGYLAVSNSVNISDGITVDIGGGSTEITLFENRELKHRHSFPFGALTLKEAFIENDRPTNDEWASLVKHIKDSFEQFDWLKDANVPVVGIGGSARRIGTVHQAAIQYPLPGIHHYGMDPDEVTYVQNKLANLPLSKRLNLDGLPKDRAETILPATIVIETLIKTVGAPRYICSNRGLRDGIFFEEMLQKIGVRHFPYIVEESFYQLQHEFQVDIDHMRQIGVLSSILLQEFEAFAPTFMNKNDRKLLFMAAKVFYIGEVIHPDARSEHTFYLLTNQPIDGLTHQERLAVACIASFKSKSKLEQFIKPFKHWLTAEEIEKYEFLGSIVKLAYALNRTNRNVIENIEVDTKQNAQSLQCTITHRDDAYFEKVQVEKYKKHTERSIEKSIDIHMKSSHVSHSI